MVEFALIFPALLLMLLGITDLGRAVYYLNTMDHAVREGARAGIVFQRTSDWDIDGNQPKDYSIKEPRTNQWLYAY